jgi:hypothetical protein
MVAILFVNGNGGKPYFFGKKGVGRNYKTGNIA